MKSSRRSGGNTRFIVHFLSFPIYLGMLSFRLPHSLVSIIFCNEKNLPVNLCNLKVIYYDSRTSLPCKKWGVEWIDTKLCALMLDNSSITYISEHGCKKNFSHAQVFFNGHFSFGKPFFSVGIYYKVFSLILYF